MFLEGWSQRHNFELPCRESGSQGIDCFALVHSFVSRNHCIFSPGNQTVNGQDILSNLVSSTRETIDFQGIQLLSILIPFVGHVWDTKCFTRPNELCSSICDLISQGNSKDWKGLNGKSDCLGNDIPSGGCCTSILSLVFNLNFRNVKNSVMTVG